MLPSVARKPTFGRGGQQQPASFVQLQGCLRNRKDRNFANVCLQSAHRKRVAAVYAADNSSSYAEGQAQVSSSLSVSETPQSQTSSEEVPRYLNWLASRSEEVDVINASANVGFLAVASAVVIAYVLGHDNSLWELYQSSVSSSPVATKAVISGAVYSVGDLMAQSYEGRDISEWDRARVLRSGLCGFLAHGPLSHFYYLALDGWFAQFTIPNSAWVTPLLKMGVDQTAWSLFWNSTYYVLLGVMKLESPSVIAQTVRNTWWDLLKAGWRLWPFVHIVTYGLLPQQHRLLFVDAVELVWVTILSLYGQQQRKGLEEDESFMGPVACALPGGDGEGGDAAEEILRGMQAEREIVFEDQFGRRMTAAPKDVYISNEEPVLVSVPASNTGKEAKE